mmetsp:Transcript_16014/g.22303  ORF Transcript_16014/g.22303 Transcript_16014/m.22303 type:complete len:343 (-) Transcript_16014:168-1196(-)
MAYVPPHRRHRPESTIGHQQEHINKTQPWGDNKSNKDRDDHFLSTQFCNAFSRICCINMKSRRDKWRRFQKQADRIGTEFQQKLQRFDAVNGMEVLNDDDAYGPEGESMKEQLAACIQLEWDTTQNAKWDRHVEPGITRIMTGGELGCAMSHVALWRQLVSASNDAVSMLIFEDDATFLAEKKMQQQGSFQSNSSNRGASRFLQAFSQAWSLLPDDWDIFYLGLSDRGERLPVEMADAQASNAQNQDGSPQSVTLVQDVTLFRPTYGFHTHAYALRKRAAAKLLGNLPVSGPLDVWLADNKWFNLNVYVPIVLNEGWRGNGASLVFQCKDAGSDVRMSSRIK